VSNSPSRSIKTKKQKPQKPGLAVRAVAARLLTRVIDDGRNLDALSDHTNGIPEFLKLDARDQGLARAIAMTSLRNRNHISAVLLAAMNRPPPKRARLLIHTLHSSIAQILFMDVPDSAAVDIGVTLIGSDERTSRFKSLTNAVLRRVAREKDHFVSSKFENVDPFPKWFSQRLRTDYGKKRVTEIASTISQRPGIDLSVKSEPAAWAERLGGKILPTGGIRLTTDTPVHELDGYKDGAWWVQDAAASMPAQLFQTKPEASVLELCAAPGGKSAQLVNFGYNVTALDISENRLKRLSENLARLNMKANLVQADILEWEPDTEFDCVLLDAPCSSTGTIRRHPDVLWSRQDQDITSLAELQFKLLTKAIEFVKPGGEIVFSNCSIFKEEGEDLLARILKLDQRVIHQKLTPETTFNLPELINGQGALRSLPNQFSNVKSELSSGLDGFFACRFTKVA